MKKKQPMPRYYGKNIVQHAQKKFLQRKALEAKSGKAPGLSGGCRGRRQEG